MANLIISFSGRENGNCDRVGRFIASENDRFIPFRELNIHPCSGCGYECFNGICRYRDDDIYPLYSGMLRCDRVFLIVPMYCGSPSSLYFIFNERCQDYFMHNDAWEEIIRRLYIIGIYGSAKTNPDFIRCFESWFDCSPYKNHVLGIERHPYGQTSLRDSVLDVPEIREKIKKFVERGANADYI